MKISVDLRLSPLQDDFEKHIMDFIKVLRDLKFTVLKNPLSIRIYGDYDELIPVLSKSIKASLKEPRYLLTHHGTCKNRLQRL